MKRISIITCARYRGCGGGKCLRSLRERTGGFARYGVDEELELVGYANCGGCPGGNIEYVPEEFLKNGCDVVHLATGFIVGYPPCPYIRQFKQFIESRYGLPVVVGTHPIPLKYMETQALLPFWEEADMKELAGHMMTEGRAMMKAYD